ncbi:MAG: OsmC family protein, partial [Candidatus Aenigmatarchaeota archaeon]
MKVEVMQLKGLTLIGRTESNHWVIMDSPYKEFGGENSAPSPMELLLMAVGGCTAMDVISILNKMRVDFKRVEVVVEGERHEDHPKYFEGIDILYKIYGKNIKHEQVQR